MRDLTQNVGNVLTIQHQTCVDEIFKCTIFVGYGGVIFLPVFHRGVIFFTGVPPVVLISLPDTHCVSVCLRMFAANEKVFKLFF